MDRRVGKTALVIGALCLTSGAIARERAPRPMRPPVAAPHSARIGQHQRITGHVAYFTLNARATRYPAWPVRFHDAHNDLSAVEGFYWIQRADTGQMMEVRLGGSGTNDHVTSTDDQVASRAMALFQAYRDGRTVTVDCVDVGGSLLDIVAVSGEMPRPPAAPAPH